MVLFNKRNSLLPDYLLLFCTSCRSESAAPAFQAESSPKELGVWNKPTNQSGIFNGKKTGKKIYPIAQGNSFRW